MRAGDAMSVVARGARRRFHAPAGAEDEEAHEEVPEDDLNPIFPELKEIVWGFGAFIVLALLMRCALPAPAARAWTPATT